MTKLPSVSVIIPTYNRAHLVGRAIRSVLDQTFQDFELIVIDDGSIDDTEAIVLDFQDPRIHYLRHEVNRGGSAARNTGIRAARGEYVAFLDSDDEWLSEKLELQLNIIETNPHNLDNLGVVITGEQAETDWPRISGIPDCHGYVYPQVFQKRTQGQITALVRKDVFTKSGLYDETLPASQDWDMMIRLAAVCEFDIVKEPLYRVHRAPGNHVRTSANGIKAHRIMFLKYAKEFALYPGFSSRLRAVYSATCLALNERKQAREEAWNSIKLNPLQVWVYGVLVLSIIDRRVYRSLVSVKRCLLHLRYGLPSPAPG